MDRIPAFLLSREDEMPDPTSVGHLDAAELLSILSERDEIKVPDTTERQVLNARRQCLICSTSELPYTVLQREWDIHLSSKTHRRAEMAKERRELGDDLWIEQRKSKGSAKKAERVRVRMRLEQPVPSAAEHSDDVSHA